MRRMFQKYHRFRYNKENIGFRLNSMFDHKEDKIFKAGFE